MLPNLPVARRLGMATIVLKRRWAGRDGEIRAVTAEPGSR